MRQKLIVVVMFLMVGLGTAWAQQGFLKGKITDKNTGEELVGAAVVVDGTTLGTITDFMGEYMMPPLEPGTYTIRIQYISYDPLLFNDVVIKTGEETVLNAQLSQATMDIEEVAVVAKANRESETILLMDQKKASIIKESIGAKQLTTMGVSDAATATSKISGVTKNEGSGDIYIRGLGDRYLSTTMNGLPIPSDDVEKKNIDLNLLSTGVIKNIAISKTYDVTNYADQTSGTVDIGSKTSSNRLTVGLSAKSNTNVLSDGIFGNFRATQNYNDQSFGFYNQPYATLDAITDQSWNTTKRSFPLGLGFSILGGKKIKLFEKDLSVFATLGHTSESEYRKGSFKRFRSNILDNSFSDVENYLTTYNTTGLVNLTYDLNVNHNLSFNSLALLKTKDGLYESGRNSLGYVFDQDPQEEGAFVRDQNLKETRLIINQLLGKHQFGENQLVKWGVAYNYVKADEPNRIRNEVNILDATTVQFAHVGDFQQRKSSQRIEDSEINGYINDQIKLIDEESKKLDLNIGGNFRVKERGFSSLFIGVRAKGVQFSSIDNFDEALLNSSLYNSDDLIIRERNPDLYNAKLGVYSGYAKLGAEFNKVSGSLGIRYELDQMDVEWDVANYVGRTGDLSNEYNNILPSLNLKYQLSENSALRLAISKTITLPEFKEVAPFEYVSQTGRVMAGNPDLKNSENYNVDLKWEMFPSAKDLVSVSAFYKQINDPINLAQTRGSSGNFKYENTGEQANVYGLEFETRFSVIKAPEADMPGLDLVLNATKMWFNQDLLDEFKYNNKTETDLQGASGFITNGAFVFSNNKEKEFNATISANYSSDKIFALGAPEDYVNSATLYNSEIIEKGFFTLDLVLSKKISNRISLRFTGKNLLNPSIEQTQEVTPLSTGIKTTEIVESYKKGISLKFGVNINLN